MNNSINDLEQIWMQRCLELAAIARGQTSPNPMVGCVIVKDNRIIGEGFHPKLGQPHAEVFAIRNAISTHGETATQGATLYVNLEPCNHHGRTPPCTEAIIQAGISQVVVGMVDPDPRVSGSGGDRLRQAGIAVKVGVEESACQKFNEAFTFRIQHKRPFGILKYAMTLDGKIATNSGHSYWVTGELARQKVHKLRSGCDAIITGANTVRLDNPHLTTHNLTEHSPLRVVMSRDLNLPKQAHLWDVSEKYKTLVVTQTDRNPEMKAYLGDRGVEVLELAELSPLGVMNELGKRGCNSVLWEGGGKLAASAIADKVVQKVYAFIAPKIIGGSAAPTPVSELGYEQMTEAIALSNATMQSFGNDWLITGYL